MRKIGKPEEYSVKALLRPDCKTWKWHIASLGKRYPVQKSVKKYPSEQEARTAADVALTQFIEALQIVAAKRR